MAGKLIGSFFFLLIGLLGVWQLKSLPLGNLRNPGSGFFPFWISWILCGLALLSFVYIIRKGRDEAGLIHWPARLAWFQIIISLLLFTGYALVIEKLGYMLSTLLLIVFFVKIAFKRSWLSTGIFGILAVLTSYGLFVWLLGIRLPIFRW